MIKLYNEYYYKKHQNGSYQSALVILNYIKSFLQVQSIIDLGCGMGTWGKATGFIDNVDYLGVDQHFYDSQYMLIAESNYLQFDLRNDFKLNKKFDLAISVEVAEHIESQHELTFINNLCNCSNIVLFSAAIPNQGGTGHINERPCSYWCKLFTKYGYIAVDCIRPFCWDNMDVEIWYRNNCILYIKNDLYKTLLSNIPDIRFPIDIIHPQMLSRILKKRGI